MQNPSEVRAHSDHRSMARAAAAAIADLELECGDVSASQEALIAESPFLGGDCVSDRDLYLEAHLAAEAAAAAAAGGDQNGHDGGEVSSATAPAADELATSPPAAAATASIRSPPATARAVRSAASPSTPLGCAPQAPSTRPAAASRAGGEGCTQLEEEEEEEEEEEFMVKPRSRPRVCARKVRGAKIRTPTPSPERDEAVATDAASPGVTRSGCHTDGGGGDPLYNAVMMIGGDLDPELGGADILVLARRAGFF